MKKGQKITVIEDYSEVIKLILPWWAYSENEIIVIDKSCTEYQVTKIYKLTWWRKLLLSIGRDVTMMKIKRTPNEWREKHREDTNVPGR